MRRTFCESGKVGYRNPTLRTHHTTVAVAHVKRAAAFAHVRSIASGFGVQLKYGYQSRDRSREFRENRRIGHSRIPSLSTWRPGYHHLQSEVNQFMGRKSGAVCYRNHTIQSQINKYKLPYPDAGLSGCIAFQVGTKRGTIVLKNRSSYRNLPYPKVSWTPKMVETRHSSESTATITVAHSTTTATRGVIVGKAQKGQHAMGEERENERRGK